MSSPKKTEKIEPRETYGKIISPEKMIDEENNSLKRA